MASWGQAGAVGRAGFAVGGVVAVAATGSVIWWLTRQVPPPAPAAPPVASQAVLAPELDAVPQAPLASPDIPPSFDLVRIEADGSAQVAGRGAPNTRVLLQVDGVSVAEATVAADGAFVALFTLAPNPRPSLLSLALLLPDGATLPGRETVALAPIDGPVLAAAESVPTPGPTQLQHSAPEPAEKRPAVPEPPAALLVTDEGVAVLQAPSSASDVPGDVTIDTIAYTAGGAVQFGGRGAAAQVVRLYLDNAELAETAVASDGQWGVTMPDIEPGLYTLRADQLDREGRVTSRFETAFKRETISALGEAAAQPAPQPSGPPVSAMPAPAATPPAADAPDLTAPDLTAPIVVAGVDPAPAAKPAPLPAPIAAPTVSRAGTEPVPAPDPVRDPAPMQTAGAPQTGAAAGPATASPEPAPSVPAGTPPTPGSTPPSTPDLVPAAGPSPVTITVQPGFTLWAIAEQTFGKGVLYVQVYDANRDKIRNPDLIYPGQVFTVPADP